jgi:hypothetical protein
MVGSSRYLALIAVETVKKKESFSTGLAYRVGLQDWLTEENFGPHSTVHSVRHARIVHLKTFMAFQFQWPEFDAAFYTEARKMLTKALNKGTLPPKITSPIQVVELHMGKQAPHFS